LVPSPAFSPSIVVRFEQLAVSSINYRLQPGNNPMTITTKVAAALCMLMALSSCANTIKGIGRDTANTVNATQNAGNRVATAASR
jgi:predicted small secreted protein